MKQFARIFILISLLLVSTGPVTASTAISGLSAAGAPLPQNRLVVFEGFLRKT